MMMAVDNNDGQLWNYLPSVIIFQIFGHLQPRDRLQAASTCRHWRQCLYHSQTWPLTRIVIDVDHKDKEKQRRHRNDATTTTSSSSSCSQTARNNGEDLKLFVARCGRFFKDVTFAFDASALASVNRLVELVNSLAAGHDKNNNTDRSKNRIESLSLRPTKTPIGGNGNGQVYCSWARLLAAVESLMVGCPEMVKLSLGCLQPLLNHSPSLLSLIARHHSQSIRSLHLASIKQDPDFYPVLELPARLFDRLVNLKTLSVDYDNVTDDLLTSLSRRATIERLVIHVHGIDDQHPGLAKSSWSRLVQCCPKLEVTVNLMHTDDSLAIVKSTIFDTDAPLTHLRAFFVGPKDGVSDIVDLVTARHFATLRSLTIVDHLKQFTGQPNSSFTVMPENPLVILAWRCKKLQRLTVIGFEVTDADLIAIARLRGSSLTSLVLPSSCISLLHSPITEDEGYYDDDKFYLDSAPWPVKRKVIDDISKPLTRTWSPMPPDQLPKAVVNRYEPAETTYLTQLLADQAW